MLTFLSKSINTILITRKNSYLFARIRRNSFSPSSESLNPLESQLSIRKKFD